jgi:hypothetical protein
MKSELQADLDKEFEAWNKKEVEEERIMQNGRWL